jgi:oligoendopeptidase F
MFEIIKESLKYYKSLKHDEQLKKRLLNKKIDYEMLQAMIDKVETNNVMISVELNDHTKLEIKPIKKNKKDPLFTGD